MVYEPTNYDYLLGLESLSDELLSNHFALYEGYVKNTNELMKLSEKLVKEGKAETAEYNEIKRRFGWEFNGMRLHEYYFENMISGGSKLKEDSDLYNQIIDDFGSFEKWEKDFRATAKIRGIGWAVLYFDLDACRLHNVWVDEHNINHLVGCVPLLVMDVWEHAYMLDFGIKRAEYIDSFFKVIDWDEVLARFGEGVVEENEE